MMFKLCETESIQHGDLLYVEEDYSFVFSPSSRSSVTSIVIDTLQLMIDKDGLILEVRGYCPYFNWTKIDISPPSYIQGSLAVQLDEIIPGVSEQLVSGKEWPVSVNSKNSWICVGETLIEGDVMAVEFASGCVAVLLEEQIKAIWLHPYKLPKKL
jgi:hypothetical protein